LDLDACDACSRASFAFWHQRLCAFCPHGFGVGSSTVCRFASLSSVSHVAWEKDDDADDRDEDCSEQAVPRLPDCSATDKNDDACDEADLTYPETDLAIELHVASSYGTCAVIMTNNAMMTTTTSATIRQRGWLGA
jgi:hypothetical protein